MTRVDLGGFALNIEVAGSGPPVVLLHGFTGSAAGWAPVVEALSPAFTTLAVDCVGHGLSDSPAALDHYQMRRAVDDLVAVVGTAGYQRASWLGYSMGGRTALQVAAFRPEAVSALVLESASPGLPTAEERAARIAADKALAQRLERDGVEPFIDFWQAIPLFASQAALPPAVWDRQRAGRLRNSAVGLANSLRGMGTGAQVALHERLAAIPVPALLLAGALDIKYVEAAREMALALPDATMQVIDDAGHAAHLERPEPFAALVRDFLRRVTSRHAGAGSAR